MKDNKSKNKKWYETKWVFFWLIMFFPVGIFGLIKRAKPVIQKVFFVSFSILFLIVLLDDSSNNNFSVNKSSALTGKYYIKKGSLFCEKEYQFDEQIKLIAQNVMKFYKGCYSSAVDIEVIIIKHGLTVKSVKGVNSGKVYWVASESIKIN